MAHRDTPMVDAVHNAAAQPPSRWSRLSYAPPLWAGILAIAPFFGGMSVLGTLIPFFVDDVLDQPKTLVGTGFTFQNAASTIGLVVTGALSDVIGLRRTVLIVSLGNVLSRINLLGFAGHVDSILCG